MKAAMKTGLLKTPPSDHEATHVPKLRANDPHEKQLRKDAIVNAAARLYYQSQALPAMSDVAQESRLAKGTLYLYFETKEALYLALHQRHVRSFFADLLAALEPKRSFGIEQMQHLMELHMLDNPNFLPLCNVCMSTATNKFDEATHLEFHLQLGGWLSQAGAALEKRYPALQVGDGMRFLHHGYAMVLGMYQLLGERGNLNAIALGEALHEKTNCPIASFSMGSFRQEALAMLRGYWQQAMTHGIAPLNTKH